MKIKKEKSKNPQKNAEKTNARGIPSDVLGSYTGRPYSGEKPEQDADDL